MKWTIYRSFCRWPVSWYRLRDGWLLHFFGLTIISERANPKKRPRKRQAALPEPEVK